MPYTRSTLIATLGTEPQVVTAGLDLLRRQGEDISHVIVIHTTQPPASGVHTALLSLKNELLACTQSGGLSLDQLNIDFLPITSPGGSPLQDVQSPAEGLAAFQFLYCTLRDAKLAQKRIHLLIAGGRKTLALFGMSAAQLLFDQDDRLWHIYSAGDFLESKRFHPGAGDLVHLIPIPVILWSDVSPAFFDVSQCDDPLQAVERIKQLQLAQSAERARTFITGSLTPAESRVVSLLVRYGMSDLQIADRLVISPRTVEEHLRSAYHKAGAFWGIEAVNRATLISILGLYYSVTEVSETTQVMNFSSSEET